MRVVADEHGNAEEVNDYYAFGGLMQQVPGRASSRISITEKNWRQRAG